MGMCVAEIACWLALSKAPEIGPVRFQRLLNHYKSPEQVLSAAKDGAIRPEHCSPRTLRYLRNPSWEAVERELDWLEHPDHFILLHNQTTYPPLLKEISAAPPVLYGVGDAACVNNLQLAIVGSRNPTPAGKEHAFQFGKALSELGMTVISGLALGIDAAAHQGALAGEKPTLAVLAHGLDQIYPARHKDLAAQLIARGGALISEFGLGEQPIRQAFPQRNRIISGMSIGTLVVEAGRHSGALITAKHALEQGREVFAIPGAINNPMAKGCHRLIRQGAKLVETIEHILEEFVHIEGCNSPQRAQNPNKLNLKPENSSEYNEVLKYLDFEPLSVDLIIERCGKNADWVSSQLLEMELKGLVTSLPGGKFIRV